MTNEEAIVHIEEIRPNLASPVKSDFLYFGLVSSFVGSAVLVDYQLIIY